MDVSKLGGANRDISTMYMKPPTIHFCHEITTSTAASLQLSVRAASLAKFPCIPSNKCTRYLNIADVKEEIMVLNRYSLQVNDENRRSEDLTWE